MAVGARALEIGTAEGLAAVSLRRLAQELGVTPMALYRHVRDKRDLVNAMTEAVLEGIDATVGFRPSQVKQGAPRTPRRSTPTRSTCCDGAVRSPS